MSASRASYPVCQGGGRYANIFKLIKRNFDDLLEGFHLLFHGPTEACVGEADGVADVNRHLGLLG